MPATTLPMSPNPASTVNRLAITLRGVVQGVGMRPFVYNAARAAGLTGFVRNEADRLRIEVQGPPGAVEGFLETLRRAAPRQAQIEAIDTAPAAPRDGEADFVIVTSDAEGPVRPTIPADLATCEECLAEVRTPGERRYGYPFTNCTNCGPRWSIIERLPYDRPRTSMAGFPLCDACRAEYEDPADRRFHAQPVACPRCGPQLALLAAGGTSQASGEQALAAAIAALKGGQIVALKGLGGFQLLVDATDEAAVERLRQRKRRPAKPFAVMLATLAEVERHCRLVAAEAEALAGAEAPILLVRRRDGAGDEKTIADSVAPGNPYLGVMLPYTPLHHLLLDAFGRPLVCTSGNLSEEPMAITTEEARERLGRIADVLLTHNRSIVRPVDDSVARAGAGGIQLLRRARGFAPQPISLAIDGPPVLALGGHLKNVVGLALGGVAVLSAHVGDLDSLAAYEVHRRAAEDLMRFFDVKPAAVACDLHPDYASTRHAEGLAARWEVPLIRVQHHHAHAAACAAEHGLSGPVLALSWDGTGYGTDGTVWGGEVLRCEGAVFERIAHLGRFPLPGGDRAAREPRRSALGLLFASLGPEVAAAESTTRGWFSAAECRTLIHRMSAGRQVPLTSSLGRLFDAVAALCGWGLPRVSFEGEAAMAVQFAAEDAFGVGEAREPDRNVRPTGEVGDTMGAYPLPLVSTGPAVADLELLVHGMRADLAAGVAVERIAARFHAALAEFAVAAARAGGCERVLLTGGCFQNGLLEVMVRARLEAAGFAVHTHRRVPPGDGGIALGQLAIARAASS